MVSQPIVEQAMDQDVYNNDPKNAYSDQRRVRTTMPGKRVRHKGKSAITIAGGEGQINEEMRSSPERDADIDMHDIQ